MAPRVAFVGTGRIGLPMLDRIVDAGMGVTALGRSDRSRANLATRPSVTTVGSAREAATGAEIVVVVVRTDAEVRQACTEDGLLDALEPGSVLVLHTTGSPFTARDLQAAAPHDVVVVDAPISGGPHDIAAGAVTIFAGGTDQGLARAKPALGTYADPVIHAGPLGSGQIAKLVNNSIFLSNIEIIDQAARAGAELGIEPATLIRCLQHGSARSAALEGVARAGSPAGFKKSTAEFLHKDAAVIRDVAQSLGVGLGGLETLLSAPGAAGSTT